MPIEVQTVNGRYQANMLHSYDARCPCMLLSKRLVPEAVGLLPGAEEPQRHPAERVGDPSA